MTSTYRTDRLQLRPLLLSDAERVELLAGDYEIAKTTLAIPHPYPPDAASAWIEATLASDEQGKSRTFAITEAGRDELIGVMGVLLHATHQRAELAYWIGKPYWGKGYGTEAAKQVRDIAFAEHEVNKLFAAAFSGNPGSWRIMEKIGMQREGVMKQHVMRFGTAHDLVYYGITRDKYNDR